MSVCAAACSFSWSRYIYEKKDAVHVDKLPRLLAKNAGQEAIFYSNLLRK